MSASIPTRPALLDHLEDLATHDERGRLAALRRGLGHPPGTVSSTFRDVTPFIPQAVVNTVHESDYFTVAMLYALHPEDTGAGNLGTTLRHIARHRGGPGESPAADKRFSILLAASRHTLPSYLRQVIGMARTCSPTIPVNYAELLRALRYWDHRDRFVQRKWARQYWAGTSAGLSASPQPTEITSKGAAE